VKPRFPLRADENSPPDDYSYIWHPTIEQTDRIEEGVGFVGLDPIYVRSMFQALWESAKQKSKLNWLPQG
jgi:hypothetical protein